MNLAENHAERVKEVLDQLVADGLTPQQAAQAQDCAGKMFRLVSEYREPGIVALGVVGALIDNLLQE